MTIFPTSFTSSFTSTLTNGAISPIYGRHSQSAYFLRLAPPLLLQPFFLLQHSACPACSQNQLYGFLSTKGIILSLLVCDSGLFEDLSNYILPSLIAVPMGHSVRPLSLVETWQEERCGSFRRIKNPVAPQAVWKRMRYRRNFLIKHYKTIVTILENNRWDELWSKKKCT